MSRNDKPASSPRRPGGLGAFLERHFDLGPIMPRAPGAEIDEKELKLSALVPYSLPYDDYTVLTKDDALVAVIKLDGIFSDSLSPASLTGFAQVRNTLWRTLADPMLTVYAHMIRRRTSAYPDGEGETYFSRIFNKRWREQFEENPFYVNDIYLTLVYSRKQQQTGIFTVLMDALHGAFGGVTHEEVDVHQEQGQKLRDYVGKIMSILADYAPRRLCIQRRPTFDVRRVRKERAFSEFSRFGLPRLPFVSRFGELPDYDVDDVLGYIGPDISEIESFFAYLLNLREIRVPVTATPIDRRIVHSTVNAKLLGKFVELEAIGSRRLASVVSMEAWPEKTSAMMLDDLLTVPAEFVLTQSFQFVGRLEADAEIQRQIRQLKANDPESNEENIKASKDMRANLLAGRAVDGLHHFSIIVHVGVPAEISTKDKEAAIASLNDAVGKVAKGFVAMGVKPVQEYLGAMSFLLSQMPGQHPKFIGRRGTISSENFAGFVSMHNSACGRLDGNLWGPAIMPFRTTTGSAYMFNFHREAEGMVAGHTAVSADTGSGKTALVTALLAMADKARPKVFFFDNREGAYVFMRAMGGEHFRLSPIRKMDWNPFQLPDTQENRLFLRDLLIMMREYNGGTTSDDDLKRIQSAINENYAFQNVKDRRLRNVAWCFGNGAMAETMKFWYGDGELAGMFDNETDSINFDTCRHYCFEMRELIVDGTARKELPIMLNYIIHRITLAMDGNPCIIVLDEGQNLVKHDIWQRKIDSLIQQIRRKNGILVFITPDPKFIYDPVESIRKQSATLILLPNRQAQYKDYIEHLGLTDAAFRFVQADAEPREFLIKRGQEQIRAQFDLKKLPEFIPILSANEKVTTLMHQIIAEMGTEDPAVWVPVLMTRAMEQDTHNLRAA